jgi:energy-coupling factor transporter ATP-binding protein EcfA2
MKAASAKLRELVVKTFLAQCTLFQAAALFYMITSIKFQGFKAFDQFSVALTEFNVIVGPNNSGKSTILDAFRILSGVYKFAKRSAPQLIRQPGGHVRRGYSIPESSLPIALEHVRYNYGDNPAIITYRFDNGNRLVMTFTADQSATLTFETEGNQPTTSGEFKAAFPFSCTIIPPLGPLEHEEPTKDKDYVRQWFSSHRAPLLFRNMWYYDSEGFDEFRKTVETTWPGMSIAKPERSDPFSPILVMFCTENRIQREVFWAGNGFQIWLQLLSHLIKSAESEIVVVDEPEVYLHPDLQRKIVLLLREKAKCVILATHSVEIINEVEPREILMVDKLALSAKRLSSEDEIQTAVTAIGSAQNVQLTRLARSKKVLFVEGQDLKYLSKLARIAGFDTLFDGTKFAIIPIGGLTQWQRISHAEWVFTNVLNSGIQVAALFDKDYMGDAEVAAFKEKIGNKISCLRVLDRKEIENYLLVPRAISIAIQQKLSQNGRSSMVENIDDMLMCVTEDLKADLVGQLVASEYKTSSRTGVDIATVVASLQGTVEKLWNSLDERLRLVPGKQALSEINQFLINKYRISITPNLILNCFRSSDVSPDLKAFFRDLDVFSKSSPT